MQNKKRAIILDMDETLEHGIFKGQYGFKSKDAMMVLRPGLDELIAKLQEAKNQGSDIVLCTTAQEHWVERLLALKPEFRTLFDTRLTQGNAFSWQYYNKAAHPLEYEVEQESHSYGISKPVTTFGYDSVLFIDDNRAEAGRLKRLFEITQGRLEKDVTYFSGFGFDGGSADLTEILDYKKAAVQNPEMAQKLEEYLMAVRNNPGCHMMCSVIDSFMAKEFTPGLTIVDEQYSAEYDIFYDKLSSLQDALDDIRDELRKQTGEEFFGYTDSELAELKEYLSTDKRYPFEGIEVSKREQLGELIQTAIDTQAKLNEAQKLKESYEQQQPKQETL